LILATVLVGLVRDYMFPLVGGSVVLSLLLTDVRSAPRNVLAFGALAVVLFITYQQARFGSRFVEGLTLEELDALRRGGAMGAQTAYLTGLDISTPLGLLSFLPLGLAYFLLSPFPWQIGSARHLLPMPEMLFYYCLIPFVLLGAGAAFRRRFSVAVVLLVTLALTTLGYGVGSTNVGTAYRHRGQVMPMLLCFAAAGIAVRDERRRAREARRLERLRAAETVGAREWRPA
jgi:hypothetical protein